MCVCVHVSVCVCVCVCVVGITHSVCLCLKLNDWPTSSEPDILAQVKLVLGFTAGRVTAVTRSSLSCMLLTWLRRVSV